MITDSQIRNKLLRKIQCIPSEKLKEVDDFISRLEGKGGNKSKALSFAGAWKNIDDAVFQEFTKDLIRNRERNKRRINE